jgi:hypothetical protein
VSRNLVDLDLIDESLGDYIIDAYQDNVVMRYIGEVRGEERDPSYWEHFENLAKELLKRQQQRRARNRTAR